MNLFNKITIHQLKPERRFSWNSEDIVKGMIESTYEQFSFMTRRNISFYSIYNSNQKFIMHAWTFFFSLNEPLIAENPNFIDSI